MYEAMSDFSVRGRIELDIGLVLKRCVDQYFCLLSWNADYGSNLINIGLFY